MFVSKTDAFTWATFGGTQSLLTNLNHVVNNQNLDKQTQSSIIHSMGNTANSVKTVTWYYNTETKHYTYRVGDSKPKGGGWKKIK
jgi:hypothetical protein